MLLQRQARDQPRQGLRPLAVPVGLPPVEVFPVDDVEDVAALEADPELVARDVEVVVGIVVEVRSVVELNEKNAKFSSFLMN